MQSTTKLQPPPSGDLMALAELMLCRPRQTRQAIVGIQNRVCALLEKPGDLHRAAEAALTYYVRTEAPKHIDYPDAEDMLPGEQEKPSFSTVATVRHVDLEALFLKARPAAQRLVLDLLETA